MPQGLRQWDGSKIQTQTFVTCYYYSNNLRFSASNKPNSNEFERAAYTEILDKSNNLYEKFKGRKIMMKWSFFKFVLWISLNLVFSNVKGIIKKSK